VMQEEERMGGKRESGGMRENKMKDLNVEGKWRLKGSITKNGVLILEESQIRPQEQGKSGENIPSEMKEK